MFRTTHLPVTGARAGTHGQRHRGDTAATGVAQWHGRHWVAAGPGADATGGGGGVLPGGARRLASAATAVGRRAPTASPPPTVARGAVAVAASWPRAPSPSHGASGQGTRHRGSVDGGAVSGGCRRRRRGPPTRRPGHARVARGGPHGGTGAAAAADGDAAACRAANPCAVGHGGSAAAAAATGARRRSPPPRPTGPAAAAHRRWRGPSLVVLVCPPQGVAAPDRAWRAGARRGRGRRRQGRAGGGRGAPPTAATVAAGGASSGGRPPAAGDGEGAPAAIRPHPSKVSYTWNARRKNGTAHNSIPACLPVMSSVRKTSKSILQPRWTQHFCFFSLGGCL